MADIGSLASTRIVIAHRLATIRHADYIYVLEQGRVVQHGVYEEMQDVEGPFRTLIRRQTALGAAPRRGYRHGAASRMRYAYRPVPQNLPSLSRPTSAGRRSTLPSCQYDLRFTTASCPWPCGRVLLRPLR